jgi:hypothetical protein
MERIRFISHRGQRVLLIDSTGCSSNEIAQIADHVPDFVVTEPIGSVLLLADFTGADVSRDSVERIKIAAVRNRRHLKRSAWVVTANMPKPLHDAVEKFSTRDIPVFGTREEALAHLTSDSREFPAASTA